MRLHMLLSLCLNPKQGNVFSNSFEQLMPVPPLSNPNWIRCCLEGKETPTTKLSQLLWISCHFNFLLKRPTSISSFNSTEIFSTVHYFISIGTVLERSEETAQRQTWWNDKIMQSVKKRATESVQFYHFQYFFDHFRRTYSLPFIFNNFGRQPIKKFQSTRNRNLCAWIFQWSLCDDHSYNRNVSHASAIFL